MAATPSVGMSGSTSDVLSSVKPPTVKSQELPDPKATNLESPSYWMRQRLHPLVASSIGSERPFVYVLNAERSKLPTEFKIGEISGKVLTFSDQGTAQRLAEAAVALYRGPQKIRVTELFLPELVSAHATRERHPNDTPETAARRDEWRKRRSNKPTTYRAVVELFDEAISYSTSPRGIGQSLATTPPPPNWDGSREWRIYSVVAAQIRDEIIPIGLEFRGMTPRSEKINRPLELGEVMKFKRTPSDPAVGGYVRDGVLELPHESPAELASRERTGPETPAVSEQRVLDMHGNVALSILYAWSSNVKDQVVL